MRISGKAIGLYKGDKSNVTYVSPKISLKNLNLSVSVSSFEEVATALANEADLFHCTLEKAWEGMSKEFTNKYDFRKIKEFIEMKLETSEK